MTHRIRDVTVAEAIAAEAGTDDTPELELSSIVTPVVQLQPRPPLAVSGYLPGTVGVDAAAVPLNTSHVGIFISGFAGAIGRVNYIIINNPEAAARDFQIRRLDAPFVGFPSVRAVPGYINAGNTQTGRVFSLTKTDTVAAGGVLMATITLQPDEKMTVLGPWIINDGALLVVNATVNSPVQALFGYETWLAIRTQPPG